MPIIVSVLPTPQGYPLYEKKEGLLVAKDFINIPAGRGSINPKTGYASEASKKEVSEAQLRRLQANKSFMRQLNGGFLKVVEGTLVSVDAVKVSKDMAEKTKSDLLTKEDLKKDAKKAKTDTDLTDVKIQTGADSDSKSK